MALAVPSVAAPSISSSESKRRQAAIRIPHLPVVCHQEPEVRTLLESYAGIGASISWP